MHKLVLTINDSGKEVRRYHLNYDETEGDSMTLQIKDNNYDMDINGKLHEKI